jgi:hypothetical protein
MDLPRALEALYGHADFGIYLKAKSAGTIAVGDRIDASAPAAESRIRKRPALGPALKA